MMRMRASTACVLTVDNPVTRLHDYDERNNTDLLGTVRTWLAHNAETRAAATALCLHPNTLRYRLRRAEEVAGMDLSCFEVRLLVYLALPKVNR